MLANYTIRTRTAISYLGWVVVYASCMAHSGCAHTPSAQTSRTASMQKIEMDPIELTRSGASTPIQIEAHDAPTLFQEGGEHLDAERYAEAAASYDHLIRSFPDSPYVSPALFNAGLAYEGLGRFADAAERYRRVPLSDGTDGGKVAKDAALRLGACYAELKRWPASIEVYEKVLRREDLNLSERLESMSRRALGLFESGDLKLAEEGFNDTLAYYKANKELERLESSFFIAMARFYSAHIGHRRFRELPLRLPQPQLEQDMQALARQFLATQEGYIETIRLKDPMWASAAGYQVGALYRELYDALVKSPFPKELDSELKRIVYSELLKSNLRTLLEKGRAILAKNLEMAGRVGVKNGWIEKSSAELEEISKLLVAIETQPIGPDAVTPSGEKRSPAPPLPTPGSFRDKSPLKSKANL